LSFLICLVFLAACQPKVQESKAILLSGPMPGSSTHREVQIVIQAAHSGSASLTYHPESDPAEKQTIHLEAPAPTPLGHQLYHFRPNLLTPGTTYAYQVALDGVPVLPGESLKFQTLADWQFRATAPDFHFITGSCNYLNDE